MRIYMAIIALCVALSGCGEIDSKMELGAASPDISVLDLDGKAVSLGDYSGKAVVLAFYKNGCSSCTESLPKLDEFVDTRGDKLGIIAINAVNSKDEIVGFLAQHHYEHIAVVQDNMSITTQRFGVVMTPTLILIDGDKIVRDKIVGGASWERIENSLNSII